MEGCPRLALGLPIIACVQAVIRLASFAGTQAASLPAPGQGPCLRKPTGTQLARRSLAKVCPQPVVYRTSGSGGKSPSADTAGCCPGLKPNEHAWLSGTTPETRLSNGFCRQALSKTFGVAGLSEGSLSYTLACHVAAGDEGNAAV